MFCSKCGFSNNEGNKFCANCGAPIQSENVNINVDQILYQIKPKFIFFHHFLANLIATSIIIMYIATAFEFIPSLIIYMIFAIPIYICKYIQWNNKKYTLYSNRIIFDDNFLTKKKVQIYYKDIREINLREGLIQRMFNLGSITISSNATGSSTGVCLYDLENPNEIYDNVRNIIKK